MSNTSHVDALSDEEALLVLAKAIDGASSLVDIERAFELLKVFQGRPLSDEHAALTHYFFANAWATKHALSQNLNPWAWEQPEREAQVIELRKAMRHPGFATLDPIRRCQILTNLANQLNTLGRPIEAIEYFDRALTLIPRFAMARGNRGLAFQAYARAVHDPGHKVMLMLEAHDALAASTAHDALVESYHSEAFAEFTSEHKKIARHLDVDAVRQTVKLDGYEIGAGEELHYRRWCLEHRLFVNPLNELGAHTIAASDVMTMSPIVGEHAEDLSMFVGFFNQVKQEYASARYLYFDGSKGGGAHFSDAGVLLYGAYGFPVYSLANEKVRTAYRMAYSILDKIALFLNQYFNLGHKPSQVSFRGVWFSSKGPRSRPPLDCLAHAQNWSLRGLFFLSKDLFQEDFREVTEPEAEGLKVVRDHLEHKYLQVHEFWLQGISDDTKGKLDIGRDEFQTKAIRLLRLVRTAIIYLSLAIHTEEQRRASERPEGTLVPLPLITMDDTRKR